MRSVTQYDTPGQFSDEVSDPLLVLVTQILEGCLPAPGGQVNILAVVAIAAVVAVVGIARLKETCSNNGIIL